MLVRNDIKNELFPAYIYPSPATINFAQRLDDGNLSIIKLSPDELAEQIGQSFFWIETVLIKHKLHQGIVNSNKNTLTRIALLAKLAAITEMLNNLAIIKVNEIVGYGVITLKNIPANSTVTMYAGEFSFNTYESDDYAVGGGGDSFKVSAKRFRNYAGFLTHAFKSKRDMSNEPAVSDFYPVSDYQQEHWHKKILTENIELQGEIFNEVPFVFFTNPNLIPEGSLLAWSYGLKYWDSRKIEPCLLDLAGNIIPKYTYQCNNEAYNKAFNPQNNESKSKEPIIKEIQEDITSIKPFKSQLKIADLPTVKQQIISYFDQYICWYKFSIFGHHHNNRAAFIKQQIINAKSFDEIDSILNDQKIICMNSKKTNKIKNKVDVDKSSYYKTICESLSAFCYRP